MTIEVAVLVVLLVVPLFYLVATLGRVQAGAYAVTAAAREAGRMYVTADDPGKAALRAHAAADLVYQAHGFDTGVGTAVITCTGDACLEPGSSIDVDTEISVPLPLVPDFMRQALPSSLTLTANHREAVEQFRRVNR